MRLLAACVLALAERGGAEQEYKYGGVDVTGERIGVMPTNTGVDLSEPNQAYCDGCLSTLESFHIQWLSYVSKESQEGDDVDQKNAGDSPPAITYNDEVEDTVNDICKSKRYRAQGLSDQVTEVCQSMIGEEAVKRKIVAQFLAKCASTPASWALSPPPPTAPPARPLTAAARRQGSERQQAAGAQTRGVRGAGRAGRRLPAGDILGVRRRRHFLLRALPRGGPRRAVRGAAEEAQVGGVETAIAVRSAG